MFKIFMLILIFNFINCFIFDKNEKLFDLKDTKIGLVSEDKSDNYLANEDQYKIYLTDKKINHRIFLRNIRKRDTTNSTQLNDSKLDRVRKSNDDTIEFDTPDATIEESYNDETYQIIAYKSKSNRQILEKADPKQYTQLEWLSIGAPRLIKTFSNKNKTTFFHSNEQGIYTFVEMLTPKQRDLIAQEIESKYGFKVKPNQIKILRLFKFECTSRLVNLDNKEFLIKGKVTDFGKYPLKLFFWLPKNTNERLYFEEKLDSNQEIDLQCELAANGKIVRENKLKIDAKLSNELELADKIFGPVESAFVTRHQMNSLSSEIYSSMNIIEEYEIPESQFNELFIEEFIKQTTESTGFKQVILKEAIESISKYSLNFDQADLKPDLIREESSKLFKFEKKDDKIQIVLDKEGIEELKNNQRVSLETNDNCMFYGLYSFSCNNNLIKSLNTTNENEIKIHSKEKDDLLRHLNNENKNDMQFEWKGEKIQAKSINVARLLKLKFSKNLMFNRIKRIITEQKYEKTVSLTNSEVSVMKNNGSDDLRIRATTNYITTSKAATIASIDNNPTTTRAITTSKAATIASIDNKPTTTRAITTSKTVTNIRTTTIKSDFNKCQNGMSREGYYYKKTRLANHIPNSYRNVRSINECYMLCLTYKGCTAVTFDVVNSNGCHFYECQSLIYGESDIWDSISIYPLY